jgi:glucose 1-dehydrogenase
VRGLSGKSAIVTGAARGIGRAIATRLADEGMHVTAVDVAGDAVKALERRSGTGRIRSFVGSVADTDAMRACVAQAAEATGQVDGLVNNAGVDFSGNVESTTRADWDRVHSVDLWGPMCTTKCALERFAPSGSIVNIASNHAIATIPDRSAYAAAKAGAVGLTRALAVELGPRGIRANAVLPGYIRTDIWSLWLDAAPDPDALLAKIAARHPVRRLGQPEDVAGTVAFLLSDDAAFMTGAVLLLDGGYSSMLEPAD